MDEKYVINKLGFQISNILLYENFSRLWLQYNKV
jgi:hypothetical protein